VTRRRTAHPARRGAEIYRRGFPSPLRRHGRRGLRVESSDLSSVIDGLHYIRPGGIPLISAALGGAAIGTAAGAAMTKSRSRHDITEQVSMPPAPPDPQGILYQESGSEQYFSSGGAPHRRHYLRRRKKVGLRPLQLSLELLS
jgi:hypothetical protein